jgi:hypothetical protein
MKIVQKPMECCGMLAADGFSFDSNDRRTSTLDRQIYFDQIDAAQKEWTRSCAIISLSSAQGAVIEEAKRNGFVIIHEFYNPNSGNKVFLMTKTLWKDREDYSKSTREYEEEAPSDEEWDDE